MDGMKSRKTVARETIKNILNGLQEQLCALSDHTTLINSISTNIPRIEDSVEQLKISNARMEEEVKLKCDNLLVREVAKRVEDLELGFESMLAAVGHNNSIEDSTGKVRNEKSIIADGYSRYRKVQNQGDIPIRQHLSSFEMQGQPLSLLERIQRLEKFETAVNARLENLERTFKDQEENTLKRISALESTHNSRMDKLKESIDKKVETADLDKFVKRDELKQFVKNAFLDTSKIIPLGGAKDAVPSEVYGANLAFDDVEFDIDPAPPSSERNRSSKYPNSIATQTDLDILADNLMKRVNVNLTNYALHHELSSQLDNLIKRVQNELLKGVWIIAIPSFHK
ncbi:hypothetical protein BKA69DRAFT_597794 [Paraphysoderma sedebokerense]|nr:hypothetical protein BKA69DRAFT_597794 [Paraphysoderma sedebokerense]